MLWPVEKLKFCGALCGFLFILANLLLLNQHSVLPLQGGTSAAQAFSSLGIIGDSGCHQKHPGHKKAYFFLECNYGESTTMHGTAFTTCRNKAPTSVRVLLSVSRR